MSCLLLQKLNVLQIMNGKITWHSWSTSQQLKFEVVEKQQTVHKFVQQCTCSFFQSEARTSKFADQADKIAHFTNPFYFPKETLNSLEVNL